MGEIFLDIGCFNSGLKLSKWYPLRGTSGIIKFHLSSQTFENRSEHHFVLIKSLF